VFQGMGLSSLFLILGLLYGSPQTVHTTDCRRDELNHGCKRNCQRHTDDRGLEIETGATGAALDHAVIHRAGFFFLLEEGPQISSTAQTP
jgi:hypothetical protein